MKRGLGIKRERKRKSDGIERFWTICPYCYYLYEYEIEYVDCCLRCQNCKKAFHGVAIEGPLPKSTVVEGKELYNISLGLFKICYSYESVVVADDKERNLDVDSKTSGKDLIDVDAGSNNIQRRRVIAKNEAATSGHLNVKEFCEKLKEKLGSIDELDDDDDDDEGEVSNYVQVVGTGIENRRGLMMADDNLDNGINREYEHQFESKSGELEFYMDDDDDDIYVGLADRSGALGSIGAKLIGFKKNN